MVSFWFHYFVLIGGVFSQILFRLKVSLIVLVFFLHWAA